MTSRVLPAPVTLDDLYARLGGTMKFGLERTLAFMEYLQHPYRNFKTVHIAGTNGKGSAAAVIDAVLRAHGFRCGRFTSPHLVDFNERITMDGRCISSEEVRNYLDLWAEYLHREETSFFEVTTGLAFKYFTDMQAEYAVVETGLGGRLDSTNVLDPDLSVITRISLDHTRILGNTLKAIAGEKAGIIKNGRPVITSRQNPGVLAVLKRKAEECGSELTVCDPAIRIREVRYHEHRMVFQLDDDPEFYEHSLVGPHQIENLALAVQASEMILGDGFDRGKLRSALDSLVWRGRFELVSADPLVIYDAGHNYDGARKTLKTLELLYPGRTIYAVLGLLKDKQVRKILGLFATVTADISLCTPDSHRSYSREELARVSGYSLKRIFGTCREAAEDSLSRMDRDDLLLIFGSHHLAADVYGLSGFVC